MNMSDIFNKLSSAEARIDRLIWLAAAMPSSYAFADDLSDFLDDEDADTVERCFGEIPEWLDLEADRGGRSESFSEWLIENGKLGFLVKFATPIMEPYDDNDDGGTYSWGFYTTTWIYADTLDEAVEKGLNWVKERRAAELAEATT